MCVSVCVCPSQVTTKGKQFFLCMGVWSLCLVQGHARYDESAKKKKTMLHNNAAVRLAMTLKNTHRGSTWLSPIHPVAAYKQVGRETIRRRPPKSKSATTKTFESGRKKRKKNSFVRLVFSGRTADSTSHMEGKAEIFLLPFGDRWLGLHSQHCPLGPFTASLNKMKKT